MDEEFNSDELSADDLAVVRAFDALDMGDWGSERPAIEQSAPGVPARGASTGTLSGGQADQPGGLADQPGGLVMINHAPTPDAPPLSPDDMLALFVGEVDEDMATIQRTLQQLEPDDQLDTARLQTLQRTAHKMKGTSGAIGYTAMASIAQHMEALTTLIIHGEIVPFIGLHALVQTVRALEVTLNSIVTYGQENGEPLAELEAEYKALNIASTPGQTVGAGLAPALASGEARPPHEQPPSTPFVRVDAHRFEQLVLHTEQLVELNAPLEHAQTEVEQAIQELHVAQARLRN